MIYYLQSLTNTQTQHRHKRKKRTTLKDYMTTFILVLLLIVVLVVVESCNISDGLKYGTLQKLSHKTFPCNYYVAEFAFEGGKVNTGSKSSAYSNTQECEITETQYDTLQNYLGNKVIYDYEDKGVAFCGVKKKLTTIKIKNKKK